MPHIADHQGQATVELLALLPVLLAIVLAAWQGVLAGHAAWAVSSAAVACSSRPLTRNSTRPPSARSNSTTRRSVPMDGNPTRLHPCDR